MRRTILALLLFLAAWPVITPISSFQEVSIPLRKGLTIVTAINEPARGDYESLKRVTNLNERDVTLSISGEAPVAGDPLAGLFGQEPARQGGKPESRGFRVRRTVRREDLKNAHAYMQSFLEGSPETFPGSTALGVSAAVLGELKTTGQSELAIFDRRGSGGALGGLLGGLLGGQAGMLSFDDSSKLTGVIRIVKGASATLTVLVNGTPTPLPVVHARGTLGDLACEFVFLDDPANPLSLRYAYGENRLQVVRIEFPGDAMSTASRTAPIASQLATTGKADIYGIYFDFASDRIKDESEPVLIEIATALTDNSAWSLRVDGHTDNIGGDLPNLDLSKRRAAAVRHALVTRYGVTAARLTTDGFGASRPKDTNATLEGRARNRRVELTRK